MNETKITFFSKNSLRCPVCDAEFYREEMFSGGGRLIAGELTDELRRKYEASRKFGEINPLIYTVTVCPSCFYAASAQDFPAVPQDTAEELKSKTNRRKESLGLILDGLDFTGPRTLREGAASFALAVACYDAFPANFTPTFKMALASLRAAWLFSDLHAKLPTENFDYVSKLFYHKARFLYGRTVEIEQTGSESVTGVPHLGPDMDKNYGYDGLLYMAGLLEFKYGVTDDQDRRAADLENAKRTVAKIFGMGKASKDKPTAMLEKAKELYAAIAVELKEETVDVP